MVDLPGTMVDLFWNWLAQQLCNLAALQLSTSAPQQHCNLAGEKLTKKKRAAPQQLSSPAAWQLRRKETTAQHLSRTGDSYCRILTDSVSLVFFFKLCHPRPILGTRSSTRGLHDLRKWVFRDGTDRHTHTTTDMATLWPTRPSGAELVKKITKFEANIFLLGPSGRPEFDILCMIGMVKHVF